MNTDVLRKGEESIFENRKRIPDILESYNIEPEDVASLIRGQMQKAQRELYCLGPMVRKIWWQRTKLSAIWFTAR